MSRILLKELLNLTEQAPQPPSVPPVPATPGVATPPSPIPTQTPEAPSPEADASPTPEDPGEYDFTKDFKTFESSIEKAKQAAKKKFLDRLNQFVKGKKVTVNASRGYGQPQKDYTIDQVNKASVDWYYNKNVVVLTDDNSKEYFLTPGINIKVEQAAPAEPETPAEKPEIEAPTEPPKQQAPPAQNEPASKLPTDQPAAGVQPDAEVPSQTPADQPEEPAPEQSPQQAMLKKKKKISAPVAEEKLSETSTSLDKNEVQKAVADLFADFIPDSRGQFDVRPYIKDAVSDDGGDDDWRARYTIEIPVDVFGGSFEELEFKLEALDRLRHYSGPGQPFSRGGVDITRHGRYYIFKFWESGGSGSDI